MPFDLVVNIETCYKYLQDVPITLVYYSHIPTAILAIFFGWFVFLKNKKSLPSKMLLGLNMSFFFWICLSFMAWVGIDSRMLMGAWALIGMFTVLFFIFSLYLVYVFIDKKDISFKIKLIFGMLLLPLILVIPAGLSLTHFDNIQCVPVENNIYTNYVYAVELVILLWIFIILISRYRKAEAESKKQITWLGLGIVSFLLTFLISGYASDYLYNAGYLWGYNVELSGIFMMTIFIGSLTYLIVKYKAFNIKMLGVQALVVGLVALIFSEFFFTGIENVTVVILVSVTVLLATILGLVLINSVRNEVKRKDDLQTMSDQLAAANDELRKLDNAKSEFISIASHQLRTPLTAIKGFISLILEGTYGEVSAVVHDALNKVYLSNERIIGLVENLLTVSRIESGRIEYRFEPTRVEDIINELNDIFIMIAKQKSMYLNILLPKDPLPEVEMDGQKIRELISNLVDNALKYSNEGGVTVKAEMANSNYVRVTVSDTGIGIPAEEIPYLFAKFSRGKDINRLHAGGTGLGLYVAKNIVEAHHGKIWVESDGAGKGSRFIMELPVKHEA